MLNQKESVAESSVNCLSVYIRVVINVENCMTMQQTTLMSTKGIGMGGPDWA